MDSVYSMNAASQQLLVPKRCTHAIPFLKPNAIWGPDVACMLQASNCQCRTAVHTLAILRTQRNLEHECCKPAIVSAKRFTHAIHV